MTPLARGLYAALLTEELAKALQELPADRFRKHDLLAAEAADRLTLHTSVVLKKVLQHLPEDERVARGIALCRALLLQLAQWQHAGKPLGAIQLGDLPHASGEWLDAILGLRPDSQPEDLPATRTPLIDTALLTNAKGEPHLGAQLLSEIQSADGIDLVMAFIRRSGLRPLLPALEEFCSQRRPLRILTTTYTNSTEPEALEQLQRIGGQIRVSYRTDSTRLHAKAWLFTRHSGATTAFIGSSNLTHSAQATGMEWNVRASALRNPALVEQIATVFAAYWANPEFEPYDAAEFRQRTQCESPLGSLTLSPIELVARPFQEVLLEQIALSREQGWHRNLLVAATGTGKTVMSAIDYARLRQVLPRARLLFVAHRSEILAQSLATFRHALRDGAFGELWVGGQRPTRFEHVFASIQSLSHADLAQLAREHFDVVILDEFHHAAAPTYQAILTHFQPVELLGLTATPERADGAPILHWFEDRIAAELRLWDAIDQQHLAPFHYYGIADDLDLREVPWRRGFGYDPNALSLAFTRSVSWATKVLHELARHVDAPKDARTLGFCVSVAHAEHMARVFTEHGLPARAVSGNTPEHERSQALRDLKERKVSVLFAVDLFNEGVDIPELDTLLLLRPTDSPTLYLQQLGRGLRRSPATGKTVCTVLDFVGQHRAEYRMERRLQALLQGTRGELAKQVQQGFPMLPLACHIHLDAVASARVLASIKAAIPNKFRDKARELAALAAARQAPVTLSQFLAETGMELAELYAGKDHSWSELRRAAKLPTHEPGPQETALLSAVGRLQHVDDLTRIEHWSRWLAQPTPPDAGAASPSEQALLRMLATAFCSRKRDQHFTLQDGLALLFAHPQVCQELRELLAHRQTHLRHRTLPLTTPGHPPLQVHASYTREEVLGAFHSGATLFAPSSREGVRYLADAKTDLFFITIDKSAGTFSPTTRYHDYALSPSLVHWQSQSTTSAQSPTGQRYQHHAAQGSHVLLFTRLNTESKAYQFLGPATYQSHEGDRPMSMVWRLHHAMPTELFVAMAAVSVA